MRWIVCAWESQKGTNVEVSHNNTKKKETRKRERGEMRMAQYKMNGQKTVWSEVGVEGQSKKGVIGTEARQRT